MWNESQDEARVIWLTRPALRTEDFFVAVGRLAQEGKLTAKGAGNPLLGAALLHRFRDEFRPTSPPPVVQPVVFGALAILARLARAAAVRSMPNESAGVGVEPLIRGPAPRPAGSRPARPLSDLSGRILIEMLFSTKAEYGVRLMVELGRRAGDESPAMSSRSRSARSRRRRPFPCPTSSTWSRSCARRGW